MATCVRDFVQRFSSRKLLDPSFFFLPVPVQEGDIIPLTDEPTRPDHIQEMNFRGTPDYSLIFD